MAQLRNKKDFGTGLLLSQSFSFKEHKAYITAIFTNLVLKTALFTGPRVMIPKSYNPVPVSVRLIVGYCKNYRTLIV